MSKVRTVEVDDDGEHETIFCCIKRRTQKRPQKLIPSMSDKMSMQNVGHYDSNVQAQVVQSRTESDNRKQRTQQRLTSSIIESKTNPQKKYKMFILKNKIYKEQILAKITDKYITTSTDILTSSNGFTESPMKQFEKSYPLPDDFKYSTPEYVAKHIARRVQQSQQIIVDLGCGLGGNTVEFAKECGYVIGVEIDVNSCQKTMEHCKICKVDQKVDILNANLFDLTNLRADVVFINPTIKQDDQTKIVDLQNDCDPNLKKLIDVCKEMAPNIIIQFPANIDLSQLAIYFNIKKQQNDKQKLVNNYSIEIEQLYLNKTHEYTILYIGEIANLSENETIKFLSKYLNSVQPVPVQKNVMIELFHQICPLITIQNLIIQVLESVHYSHKFETFLEILQQNYKLELDLLARYRKMTQTHVSHDFDAVVSVASQSYVLQKQLFNKTPQIQDDENILSPVNYSLRSEELNNQYSYQNYFDQFENNEAHYVMNLDEKNSLK